MEPIRIIFTTRKWNPVSWLIRWAIPRTRFALAQASHCMIVDGDCVIEASMTHGVRRVLGKTALDGAVIVDVVDYSVPNAAAGIAWARSQVGKEYDWRGVFGIALAPDRNWQDETDWFCFELAAAALAHAGRDLFADYAHITGSMLISMKP